MKRIKIKIKNSIVCIGNPDTALRSEIERFDLADSTPLDCMEFIRRLKSWNRNPKDRNTGR